MSEFAPERILVTGDSDFAEELRQIIQWYWDNEGWWRTAKAATEENYAVQGQ